MVFRRTFLLAAGLFLLGVSALWAGDSASFTDLGFSPDDNIYMFAQHGVKSGTLKPWAELYVVDVLKNDFVPGGRISHAHDRPIDAGQDGAGALYRAISENSRLIDRYRINSINQGQPLYIALDGDPAWDGKTITFRDFVSGVFYRASLTESITGTGGDFSSSFYIRVECHDSDGSEKAFVIGTYDLKRPLIASYRIKKVLMAPSGKALVFVIEMKRQTNDGYDIRYMVETLPLN